MAAFDGYIAPARDLIPKPEDIARLREVMAALTGGNIAAARVAREQLGDPVARKLADWALYRQGAGSARDIKAFLDANPDWPLRDALTARAEEQLFTGGGSARDIKAFFNGADPKSGVGHAALASALLAEGDEAKAKVLAAKVWRQLDLPATLEVGFLERFSKILGDDDHKVRLDRFLLDDKRWVNERNDRAAIARRVIALLSQPSERQKAEARLAVFLRSKTADQLMAQFTSEGAPLPAASAAATPPVTATAAVTPPADATPVVASVAAAPDWGFVFQRIQWLRRLGRHDEAWKALLSAPTDLAIVGDLDDWWDERRLAAYDALKQGKPGIAYDLVKAPGALGVNPQKDATFFAGWIALKHLSRPKDAEVHFRAMEQAADGPLSRSKAAYWLARTYEANGASDKVRAQLESAARNTDTFYGLLARQELDPSNAAIIIPAPETPSPDIIARFNVHEVVKATVIARKAGLDLSLTRAFLNHLRIILPSEAEQAMVAHLADALGDTQMAVRIAKAAVARGLNLITSAYPIHPMPAYQPLRPPPEPAVLLGVARQESEFNTNTMSGAGARGLLQVMPITAQHVCTDYRLKCEIDRLVKEPAYNAMMASAYIGDRMDEFTGSYVLTLAGYNAGPGRARQWVREFGDPRDPKVDPIDWINRIPFEETREYVQKVLANIQIYRARLGDEASALRLKSDLRRTGNLRRATTTGERAAN